MPATTIDIDTTDRKGLEATHELLCRLLDELGARETLANRNALEDGAAAAYNANNGEDTHN